MSLQLLSQSRPWGKGCGSRGLRYSGCIGVIGDIYGLYRSYMNVIGVIKVSGLKVLEFGDWNLAPVTWAQHQS